MAVAESYRPQGRRPHFVAVVSGFRL